MSVSFALHLLRHGEPEGAGRLIGHVDAPPLPQGIALCRQRAEAIAVRRIVSSDLARAWAAAEIIAAHHGLPLYPDPRWRELDFGDWEGANPVALPAQAMVRFHADPSANPPPGGEPWGTLCQRVAGALSELNEATLVVTHGGAIRVALAGLLGLNHRQSWTIALPYGALVSLRVLPGAARLAQITGW